MISVKLHKLKVILSLQCCQGLVSMPQTVTGRSELLVACATEKMYGQLILLDAHHSFNHSLLPSPTIHTLRVCNSTMHYNRMHGHNGLSSTLTKFAQLLNCAIRVHPCTPAHTTVSLKFMVGLRSSRWSNQVWRILHVPFCSRTYNT